MLSCYENRVSRHFPCAHVNSKRGSGSLKQDDPLPVVAMKKEEQAGLVHHPRLGKRQRHTHKTGQSLAQRVIPALHVGGFSGLFSYCRVLLLRDHRRIGRPEIREAVPLPIPLRNRFPQPLARPFAPITHCISDDLSRFVTESNPNPRVVCFFEHKRPELVQFQGRRSGIFGIRGEQSSTQRRKLSYFFLIQLDTVVRETPKVRVRPRRLLRS